MLLYNNRAGTPLGLNYSSVVELVPDYSFTPQPDGTFLPAAPLWEYTAPNPVDMYAGGQGSVERLPNGNTLINTNDDGWMLEVDSAGTKHWEYFNPFPTPTSFVFQVSYYERSLWATPGEVSAGSGGAVAFDLVAGSRFAGDLYLVLGSLSGTQPGLDYAGFNLPLNPDPYFLLTVNHAGGGLLPGTFGLLDGTGNGSASLALPPGLAVAAAGLTAHHAFAALDPVTLLPTHTSNPVATAITP